MIYTANYILLFKVESIYASYYNDIYLCVDDFLHLTIDRVG